MPTTFMNIENSASSTLRAGHTAADGTLKVGAGDGLRFGSTWPARVTAVHGTTGDIVIFRLSGKSTDDLTVSAAIEGTTDIDLPSGSVVEMRWTKGGKVDIEAAINTLEGGGGGGGGGSSGVAVGTNTLALGPGAGTAGAASLALDSSNGSGVFRTVAGGNNSIAAGNSNHTTNADSLVVGSNSTAGPWPVQCTIAGTAVTIAAAYGNLVGTLVAPDGGNVAFFALTGGTGPDVATGTYRSARWNGTNTVLTLAASVTSHTSGYAALGNGSGCLAAGNDALAQGEDSTALGNHSVAGGEAGLATGFAAYADLPGKLAIGGGTFKGYTTFTSGTDTRSPFVTTRGEAQSTIVTLVNTTDSTAPRVLVLAGENSADPPLAASPSDLPLVRPGYAYAFDVTVVGRRTDGSKFARFKRSGLVASQGNTTALVGAVQTIGSDIAQAGWSVSVSAASGALQVTVTGEATVHWAASLQCVEVG